ncbi:MAG: M48 family metallopeptidase [Bacilli bacterium]|nr:M48 family metallopeptidase [Bacilli bacterium]
MVKRKDYVINGITYHAEIERKAIRGIYVSAPNEEMVFSVRVPLFVTNFTIDDAINKLLPRLLKKKERYQKKQAIKPEGEDFTYLLGKKENVTFSSKEELLKFAKKNILPLYEERLRYYESIMGVKKPYKLILRNMSTRYGVNSSRTHRISLGLILVHYPLEVADAIIVHELAHDFQRNHSKRFYAIVYKYCPDYKRLHAKLTGRLYEADNI